MSVAKRLCPDAVVMPVRGARYRDVSKQVFDVLHEFTPLVQPLSVDEAFLDVTGSQRLLGDGPTIAQSIRARIREVTQLTASVGVAPNKFIAKLASEVNKPDGLTVVPPDDVRAFLDPLPIERMWGVGPAAAKRFAALGVRTFADLARLPDELITRQLGEAALRFKRLAAGDDARAVTPDREAKSISQEQTFGIDLGDRTQVARYVVSQAEHVAWRMRRYALAARTVTVKIRFGAFQTVTRSHTLDEPTDRTDVLTDAAVALFDAWAAGSFEPVRLIGVGVSQLCAATMVEPGLFIDETGLRRRRIDATADAIRDRYGPGAISAAGAMHRREHTESEHD